MERLWRSCGVLVGITDWGLGKSEGATFSTATRLYSSVVVYGIDWANTWLGLWASIDQLTG